MRFFCPADPCGHFMQRTDDRSADLNQNQHWAGISDEDSIHTWVCPSGHHTLRGCLKSRANQTEETATNKEHKNE